jgi:hypothetical protein
MCHFENLQKAFNIPWGCGTAESPWNESIKTLAGCFLRGHVRTRYSNKQLLPQFGQPLRLKVDCPLPLGIQPGGVQLGQTQLLRRD